MSITLSSTFFILLDELIIGTSQRRIGPFNLGYYGIYSSIVNGCNLIITQFIIPKYHFYFGFQSFPAMLFILCLTSYSIIYPSHTVNLMLSFVLIIIVSGISILFTILSAFSGNSKYSMLGCIRIISQLISFELIWTTILSFFIWSLNEVIVVGYSLVYIKLCSYCRIILLFVLRSLQPWWVIVYQLLVDTTVIILLYTH